MIGIEIGKSNEPEGDFIMQKTWCAVNWTAKFLTSQSILECEIDNFVRVKTIDPHSYIFDHTLKVLYLPDIRCTFLFS